MNPRFQKLLYNGNHLPKAAAGEVVSCADEEKVRAYDSEGRFAGIYEYHVSDKMVHIVKMFLDLSNT